jgi:hypothetical protein
VVVSGRANPALAGRIAEKLGVTLGGVTTKTFSNGEVYCRYEESIRGSDLFIVQPTCGNPETGITANDALMELLLMVDAAVGASAHRVIAVTPWYGYSRQDKKSLGREPISARLVARALETAGDVGQRDWLSNQSHTNLRQPIGHAGLAVERRFALPLRQLAAVLVPLIGLELDERVAQLRPAHDAA